MTSGRRLEGSVTVDCCLLSVEGRLTLSRADNQRSTFNNQPYVAGSALSALQISTVALLLFSV